MASVQSYDVFVVNCKPITAMNIIDMKIILAIVNGSLRRRIPIRMVQVAPIPVQTAYAVPTGILLDPMERQTALRM